MIQVSVRYNNIESALKILKKQLQREGLFKTARLKRAYEKPSEKVVRRKAESLKRKMKVRRSSFMS